MEVTSARYKLNQPPKKPRRSKRVLLWVVSFVLLASTSGYSMLALTKSVPTLSAEAVSLETKSAETVTLPWPSVGQAAIGDLEEGLLVRSSSGGHQKPIASMTKVITALAILEKQPLALNEQGKTYRMTARDVAIYRDYVSQFGSVMPVREGQVLSQYQALEALLLPSANNIADSFTVKIFGSTEEYLDYANELLVSWGLKETVVRDASGFSPGSVSTPSDMVVIGQKALKNPVIAEIVKKKTADIPGVGTIQNTNLLLDDKNVVGIKTGTTDEAGSCLLFAVKHGPNNDQTMIGVVMGQSNWTTAYRNIRTLRDAALNYYGTIEVLPAGAVVGNYETPWGESAQVVTKDALTVYGWKGETYEAVVSFGGENNSQLSAGQTVGEAKLQDTDLSVSLITTTSIKPPSAWWRLTNYW